VVELFLFAVNPDAPTCLRLAAGFPNHEEHEDHEAGIRGRSAERPSSASDIDELFDGRVLPRRPRCLGRLRRQAPNGTFFHLMAGREIPRRAFGFRSPLPGPRGGPGRIVGGPVAFRDALVFSAKCPAFLPSPVEGGICGIDDEGPGTPRSSRAGANQTADCYLPRTA